MNNYQISHGATRGRFLCVWSKNQFGFGSKEPTASYTPCEPATS